MNAIRERMIWNRAAGLLVVLALHGAVLYGLWHARVIPPPTQAVTLFVNFINPSPQPRLVPPVEPPKPAKREAPRPLKPTHAHLAAQASVTSPTEAVEPLPAPSAIEAPLPPETPAPAPPSAPPKPAGPVTLASELAVTCTQRTPPSYPPLSRRLGEIGKVLLRVELDETGRVSAAQVISSSGFNRLDSAALAAVRNWRCQPAHRDGLAVRSVATQPFNFTLEGR